MFALIIYYQKNYFIPFCLWQCYKLCEFIAEATNHYTLPESKLC